MRAARRPKRISIKTKNGNYITKRGKSIRYINAKKEACIIHFTNSNIFKKKIYKIV